MSAADLIDIPTASALRPAADGIALLPNPGLDALRGERVVVKYGGAAMGEDDAEECFARDVAGLRRAGVEVVVVHGGGNEITRLASRLGLEGTFVGGHRRTDDAMMEAVVMALAGKVNKDLVRGIITEGAGALGLCGADNALLRAWKLGGDADLGLVGEVASVNTPFLKALLAMELVPVIAPVGLGMDGELYNINADLAAGAVAAALGARMLIYLSNIPGIEVQGEVAQMMREEEARRLIAGGIISGGMLPKVRSAFAALAGGTRSVRIVDGRLPHALLRLCGGESLGTAIMR